MVSKEAIREATAEALEPVHALATIQSGQQLCDIQANAKDNSTIVDASDL